MTFEKMGWKRVWNIICSLRLLEQFKYERNKKVKRKNIISNNVNNSKTRL